MICWLKGQIILKNNSNIVLDVNGVGYEILLSDKSLHNLKCNDLLSLHIYEQIKEDSITLFGFLNQADLNFFKQLIDVKGVGPKIGLAVLNNYSVDQLIDAINSADVSVLTNISGIGLKSAQRIILELKGKLSVENIDKINNFNKDNELIAALKNLGYSTNQIQVILPKIDPGIELSEKIKQALKEIR